MNVLRHAGAATALLLSGSPRLRAQASPSSPSAPTAAAGSRTTVVAGPQYDAGWFHRLMLGAHYRDLWTTPVDVEVLDLSRFAGGLTPTACGGGRQTKSLRFRGGDGGEYAFRSVDKDPTAALPPQLRASVARDVVQDQISSAHPGGALVVAPLLQSAGVLNARPELVVLPSDARLEPFSCVHAGMLGTIEERPTDPSAGRPGFAGVADVAGTAKLFEHLEDNPDHRVDAHAYLSARLMDFLVGDWDRHQDQWRWGRFDSAGVHWWRPIPRDRDQAFARLDGILLWIAGFYQPELVGFDDEYAGVGRLAFTGRVLDRRLLSGLERAAWDSIARALRIRLTDSIIDAAVASLPPEYRQSDAPPLDRSLKRRRDLLPEIATEFYRHLAHEVDVVATDRRDFAEVERQAGGRVVVRLSRRDGAAYFQRTFDREATSEVRLYLHGGDDRVTVRGTNGDGPLVRIIGGGGDDAFSDSSTAGRILLYDDRGSNQFVTGPGTGVDRAPYPEPAADSVTLERPRDWGAVTVPFAWMTYSPDLGLFLGGGLTRTRYGFRRLPFDSRIRLRGGYATLARKYRAEFLGEFRGPLAPATIDVHLRASGLEVLNFYGFGNETPDAFDEEFYEVDQQQYLVAPALRFDLSSAAELAVGPAFRFAQTEPGGLVESASYRTYGSGEYGQLGAALLARVDTRDNPRVATRGIALTLGATYYPTLLDVVSAFGSVQAHAATYLSPRMPLSPTLALRVGGKKVWGTYPFHEAAVVGGWNSVRGFPEDRFAGDAALSGSAELRLALTRFSFLLPAELGVFALADAGRVWLEGETSDKWHGATGFGLWIAVLDRSNALTIAMADGGTGTRLYIRAGFAY
jgi:hypothetical protein